MPDTYRLSQPPDHGPGQAPASTAPCITCLRCGRTSYHPKDIAQWYCGFCHLFHESEESA